MTDIETLKGEIKKLSAKAINAKMNLHDLAEELPTDWDRIPVVAEATYAVFKELTAARKALKAARQAEAAS